MQTQQTTILPQLTNLLMNLIPQHVHMIAVNQFQLIWVVYGQMVLQQCGGRLVELSANGGEVCGLAEVVFELTVPMA